ncbi:MAG TPA: ABC transporter ATP-binding protein [Desulfobacterales bacterium]|nr:ABC transporter ATP-binding protein [Desulfobacterales bacterium]
MSNSKYILEVTNVSKNFGGLQAINQLSFKVENGLIFSIIGPNGAGKTTAINLITGIYPPTSGEIFFQGQNLSRKRPFQLAYMGIGRTFQNIQVFCHMTVRENIMVGLHTKSRCGFLKCLFYTPMVWNEEKRIREKTDTVLNFLDLEQKADARVDELPYGDQKRVEIARSLAMGPKLLLLDEPVAGLNLQETKEMAQAILKIKKMGVTVILVEHDMNLIMGISDTITVLNYGEKIAEGDAKAVRNNPKVIEAYLGKEF